ncbi:MAG: glycoside hydrolase 43 family protein [Lentisphaeria bacterium]|nr:glycoside hydrolase 43 family protein [Lentisphaeria bacterium]
MKHTFALLALAAAVCCSAACATADDAAAAADNGKQAPLNPIIWADVPDVSVLRVGDTYYMTSTTMHMNPGVPVMMSKDLVNWEIVSYCYDDLLDNDLPQNVKDRLTLSNGQNEYGNGTWASCIRYKDGTFYVSSFSQPTNRTYIWTSKDPTKGDWKRIATLPRFHDHTLVLDKDGRNYIIWDGGDRKIVELTSDLTAVKKGGVGVDANGRIQNKVLVSRADTARDAGNTGSLLEGSQMHLINGKYYLFNIGWPDVRSVYCARADKIEGPYESKKVFSCEGIAQGGLVDTPDGKWYAMLFGDRGGVGRIPFLVPVTWKDGWPMIGTDGDGKTLPALPINVKHPAIPKCVASDEFNRKSGDRDLPLVWQWNHIPVNSLWSLKDRPGWIRFKTGDVVNSLEKAKNTLTQRTFGPTSTAEIKIDTKNMKNGDYAGLSSFQAQWGFVGVKMADGKKTIVMCTPAGGGGRGRGGRPGGFGGPQQGQQPQQPQQAMNEIASVPLEGDIAYLRVEVDVAPVNAPAEDEYKLNAPRKDQSYFYYSKDGKTWTRIGNAIRMPYSMPHFMGYRFGIFNFATKAAGGFVDVDYFRIGTDLSPESK